jgi:AcrR family transcriptional regulator
MNRNAERGRNTRAHLVEVATRLFAGNGYEATSIERVLAETGVSRGSLYHHFAGKDALFGAVLESVEAGVVKQFEAAIQDCPDPLAVLRTGCRMWIQLAGDPVIQRVVLIDAPAVLGWEKWRTLYGEANLAMIRETLRYAAQIGRLPEAHVDVFAHLILAGIEEIALLVARADDPVAARADAQIAVSGFLDRILLEARS